MSLVPSDSMRAYLEKSSTSYHDQLDAGVREYLTGERGISEEIIARFRLGLVVDPAPGHETYRGCLSIPYLTPSGSVTSIRFRTLPPADKKYLSVAGDMGRLYNTVDLERGTRAICVTEGEPDCWTAVMCGLPTVGIPGATSWNPVWARLLSQYDAVYTLSDDDDAGQKLPATLGKDLDNIRDVPMQIGPASLSGGDVNKFVLEYGAEELRKKVGVK
jgi:DNA primase